jgi:hypothetical protein
LITAGIVTEHLRIVALGPSILLAEVCAQLLVAGILHQMGASNPFRVSSVAKGEKVRSGVYAIAEDIVAVDGGQGQTYRRQLEARYLYSEVIRSVCFRLDLIWGVSGIAAAGLTLGLMFGLDNADVGYGLGKSNDTIGQ